MTRVSVGLIRQEYLGLDENHMSSIRAMLGACSRSPLECACQRSMIITRPCLLVQ